MRERFEQKKPGDDISHREWNDLTRIASRMANVAVSPWLASHHSSSKFSIGSHDPHTQFVMVVCGPSTSGESQQYEVCRRHYSYDSQEWVTDEIRYELDAAEFPYELSQCDKVVAWWDDQRGKFVMISCVECANDTTEDVTTSTTTTTTGELSPCSGRCKWLWNTSQGIWLLSSDTCENTTTTTTTTSTSTSTTAAGTSTTTTTTRPLCCPDTTTSTTTTASLVEEEACSCAYPAFCGVVNGECTYTTCVRGSQTPTVSCTSTTTSTSTTTCDCNTTTTTTVSPGCLDGCDWKGVPSGFGGFVWLQLTAGCSSDCPCPAPGTAATDCATEHTPCVTSTTTPPPIDYCIGQCFWIWSVDLLAWVRILSSTAYCSGNVPCTCIPPSVSGSADCSIAPTPCFSYNTTTTTAGLPDPCGHCYTSSTTTTTSTTTTGAPCDVGTCKYAWDGTAWVRVASDCPVACPCPIPGYDGTDATCETAVTECGQETTTTTTTTTTSTTTSTTTTCCPSICGSGSDPCVNVICVGGIATLVVTCDCPPGLSPYPYAAMSPGQPCTEGDRACIWCESTTTTTTTTSTTTTTTCPVPSACGPGSNTAVYQCDAGVWSVITDCCDANYAPDPPVAACDGGSQCVDELVNCTSTTTTTSTSTTAACTGDCQYTWNGSAWIFNPSSSCTCTCTEPAAPGTFPTQPGTGTCA